MGSSYSSSVANHTISVGLYCSHKNSYQNKKACNLTTTDLLICGNTCGNTGMEFEIIFNPICHRHGPSLRLPAQIARNTIDGTVFEFTRMGEQDKHMLEDIIWPKWDGLDMFEGLLVLAAYEDATDLAGWLKLTSLVNKEYKQLCCTHRFDHKSKD